MHAWLGWSFSDPVKLKTNQNQVCLDKHFSWHFWSEPCGVVHWCFGSWAWEVSELTLVAALAFSSPESDVPEFGHRTWVCVCNHEVTWKWTCSILTLSKISGLQQFLLLKQTSDEWCGDVVWKAQNNLWLLTFLLSLSLLDNVKAVKSILA